MHSLDNVTAVVEHPANVLSVHGAGEVWVAVMFAIPCGCADPLRKKKEKLSVRWGPGYRAHGARGNTGATTPLVLGEGFRQLFDQS